MKDPSADPPHDCALCPRLREFIEAWRERQPAWFNGPVPTLAARDGDASVEFLVIGLAPGLRGANRTGRPFTGDYAGDLLYATLARFGFAHGAYLARPDDGLRLERTAITNAVRCVPPENRPGSAEINTCRQYLSATIRRFPRLRAMMTLGTIAHQSTLRALGVPLKAAPFAHGARYEVGKFTIFPSYHCSRYNTNTGRLTETMFAEVVRGVREMLDRES